MDQARRRSLPSPGLLRRSGLSYEGRERLRAGRRTFLNRPKASDRQRTYGPICPWKFLLFNSPSVAIKEAENNVEYD